MPLRGPQHRGGRVDSDDPIGQVTDRLSRQAGTAPHVDRKPGGTDRLQVHGQVKC